MEGESCFVHTAYIIYTAVQIQVLFQEKDRELTSAKKQIEELHHEITQYQMDSDRTSIVAMTKVDNTFA